VALRCIGETRTTTHAIRIAVRTTSRIAGMLVSKCKLFATGQRARPVIGCTTTAEANGVRAWGVGRDPESWLDGRRSAASWLTQVDAAAPASTR
jgi:hypothetical protein